MRTEEDEWLQVVQVWKKGLRRTVDVFFLKKKKSTSETKLGGDSEPEKEGKVGQASRVELGSIQNKKIVSETRFI